MMGAAASSLQRTGFGSKLTADELQRPPIHDIRILVVRINLAPLRAPFLGVND